MVNPSSSSSSSSSIKENIPSLQKTSSTTTAPSDKQKNMLPVLFQMPGGNIISSQVDTSRLTASQIIELQKNTAQLRGAAMAQMPILNSSTVSSANKTNNISTTTTGKSPLQSFTLASTASSDSIKNNLPSPSGQSKNSIKLTPKLQQVLQSSGATLPQSSSSAGQQIPAGQIVSQIQALASSPNSMNKDVILSKFFQEQLKNLTLAQREQVIRQFATGKVALGNNVNAPMLLASILKNKNLFPMSSIPVPRPPVQVVPTPQPSTKKSSRVSCILKLF